MYFRALPIRKTYEPEKSRAAREVERNYKQAWLSQVPEGRLAQPQETAKRLFLASEIHPISEVFLYGKRRPIAFYRIYEGWMGFFLCYCCSLCMTNYVKVDQHMILITGHPSFCLGLYYGRIVFSDLPEDNYQNDLMLFHMQQFVNKKYLLLDENMVDQVYRTSQNGGLFHIPIQTELMSSTVKIKVCQ